MGKPRGRGENPGQPVAVGVPHFPWRQQFFCTIGKIGTISIPGPPIGIEFCQKWLYLIPDIMYLTLKIDKEAFSSQSPAHQLLHDELPSSNFAEYPFPNSLSSTLHNSLFPWTAIMAVKRLELPL